MLKIEEFPDEILQLVFQELPPRSLGNCRCVCRAWYSRATYLLYEQVHFIDEDQVDIFLAALAKPVLPSLFPVGQLVKGIEFGPYIGGQYECMSTSDNPWDFDIDGEEREPVFTRGRFNKLLKYCPNVEKVVTLNENFEDEFLCLLADARENLRWKHLKQLPSCSLNVQYNYRKSLTHVVADEHYYKDFEFLSKFPCIEKLDIPLTPLDTMEKLESVLSNCPRLQRMYASFPVNVQVKRQGQITLHPSIRELHIANYGEKGQKNLMEYLLHTCPNLSRLRLLLEYSEQEAVKGIFAFSNIIAHMYTSANFCVELDIENLLTIHKPDTSTHYIYTMLRNYFDCLFKPHNKGNIGQCYTKISIKETLQRYDGLVKFDIHWKKRLTGMSTLDINLDLHDDVNLLQHVHKFFGKFSSYINELEMVQNGFDIHDAEERSPISSFIETYRVLKSISFTKYSLGSIKHHTNKTIESLSINSSFVITKLLTDISNCCSNLKTLCLSNNIYNGIHQNIPNRESNYLVVINMSRTSLDRLDFSIWDGYVNDVANSTRPVWLLNVKTCYKDAFYKIIYPDPKPAKISGKEFVESVSTGGVNQIIFHCGIIQKLKLNDTSMEL
ncbi:hypothetical protein G6F22_001576 [Rhizopus arrhizus]|nr:hypothetical protein G6F22_001576 [Rhizopus arrhizus]